MSLVNKLVSVAKLEGPSGVGRLIALRLGYRPASYQLLSRWLTDRTGIEVGGPSPIFTRRGLLPVYPLVRSLDNCTFAATTLWEQRFTDGADFVFEESKRPGRQYIREAIALAGIEDGKYEFVLSSHALEHTANPIRAIREWMRVLQGGGILVLVVPHRDATFDHRRPVTTLAHLQDDSERGTTEDDTTHLPEILALHDLGRDPGAPDRATFEARAARNEENRSLHHHVFDTDLVARLLDSLDLRILGLQPLRPCHIVAVAQKRPWTGEPNNRTFVGADAAYHRLSPFKTDWLTRDGAPQGVRDTRCARPGRVARDG